MDPHRPTPRGDRRARTADRPPGGHERRLPRAPGAAAVTLVVHAHADGRAIVVRRAEAADGGAPAQVHIDAVVR